VFERGYKAWCERYASEKRQELGLRPEAPLNPHLLAANLGIQVLTPHKIPNLSATAIETLLKNDGKTPSCWSAVTLVVGAKTIVILNSSHSLGRQSNDLAHELAHRIRSHETHSMEVSSDGIMLISEYDKLQEAEADWLAGCLLLPREALVKIQSNKTDSEDAAQMFGVSVKMLKYRLSMTGVARQFAH
jgi:Zn-dependent peptidase ImmA (M78 family)